MPRVIERGGAGPAKIVVFGFDVAEISQIRRIRALRDLGHHVHSFTMRRGNMNRDFTPDWPNTHLFVTKNERLFQRGLIVLVSVLKMLWHRGRLAEADVIWARNLDMLLIAAVARRLAGASHVPLVYECLDIHGALSGSGMKARLLRGAERCLLRRCAMLVVSSPGFLRQYFEPVQGYRGATVLLENKLALGAALPERPCGAQHMRVEGERPLRLGWVGSLRCAPSLALLRQVAEQMAGRVEIHMHGVVHHHALPDFDAVVAGCAHMRFHGAYHYPQDLAALYGGLDLLWSQDLWQRGGNSDWLLPNRIYEASWAGCPSLAVATSETGRRVQEDQLGWVIARPEAPLLIALLKGLSHQEIAARRSALLARDARDFVQGEQDLAQVINRVLQRPCHDGC